MKIVGTTTNGVIVELDDGEEFAHAIGPAQIEVTAQPGLLSWDALVELGLITDKTMNNAHTVTDTQFIQALAESKYSIISWDEAYNWGGQGQLPQILITALDKITDTDTRNRAYMKARSAKSYIYSDRWVQSILPLLPEEVVAKMPGTDAQDKLQQLFNFAATL